MRPFVSGGNDIKMKFETKTSEMLLEAGYKSCFFRPTLQELADIDAF
jgi:hypothetical protein